MKIMSLHLLAFSHFTNRVIDLSRGKEGLHIIYGPNESGKSSSLRALRQVLYGIPAKSTDNFRHAHPDMRIGVTLRHSDGSILKAVRRKGNSKTLRQLDKETEIIDNSVLQRFLGNINQSTFESMFGIDHATLVSGGEAILKGSGELGQLLFSTGAGIANLKSVQESLEKEMQELYVRAGSTRRINKQLTEYSEAKKNLRESELPSSEWDKHDQALKTAQGRKAHIDREVLELSKKVNQLKRFQDASPLIAERKLYIDQLLALQSVPLLPPTFAEDVRSLLDQSEIVRKEQAQAQLKLASLQAELNSLDSPLGILDFSGKIEQLQQALGSHQKAAVDKANLVHSLEDEQARAKACLRELGKDLDFEGANNLRLSVQEKTRMRALALEKKALWQAQNDAEAQVRRLDDKLKLACESLQKIEKLPSCDRLASVYRLAQQDPQLDQRSATEIKAHDRSYKQLMVDLRKLGVNIPAEVAELELSLNSLLALQDWLAAVSLIDLETLEQFEKEFSQLNKELEAGKDRLQALNEEIASIDYQLDEQNAIKSVPDEESLSRMRELRNKGWNLVRRAWLDNDSDPEELNAFLSKVSTESTESNEGRDLSKAFQTTIESSDSIADRLRTEAEFVARKAQLTRQSRQLKERLKVLSEKQTASQTRLQEKMDAWKAIWTELSERYASPTQAKMWLSAFQNLLANLAKLIASYELSEQNLAKANKLLAELSSELASLGCNFTGGAQSLAALLQDAQNVLERARSQKQSQTDLEREITKLSSDKNVAEESLAKSKSQIENWLSAWQPAVSAIGLDASVSPEELTVFLDKLDQFFSHYENIANYNRRVAGIDRDALKFKTEVFELAKSIDPDMELVNVERVAQELYARLKKTKEVAARRKSLCDQETELKDGIEIRSLALTNLQVKRQRMLSEAHAETDELLIESAKKSEQKRKLSELLDNYNRQLARLSPDQELDEFLALCAEKSAESIAVELPQLEQKKKELEDERDQIQVTIGSELQIIKGMDGSANAAESAARVQQILAELGQDVEQYGRIKLASQLLKKAIERYRERHQSPILKRASELFSSLSNGNFAGLQEDFNERGEPVLFGVRADNGALTPIEGMSEGTCDQVYLALRLASLSLYLDREEAIPFIVDDILVNFDDDRSLATLKVLTEFSKRTQVIMFTHHSHIVDIARDNLDRDHVFFNSLVNEEAANFDPTVILKEPKQQTLPGLSLTP